MVSSNIVTIFEAPELLRRDYIENKRLEETEKKIAIRIGEG